MPSADSRIRDGLASRLAHSADPSAIAPACSCSPWARRWLGRIAPDARDFVSPVSPIIRYLIATASPETQRASRGKLRLLSAHDRQIYVAWPYDG